LAKCGDEFGMPGCHAAAEIDGRVVANDLMIVDAHTLGASFWGRCRLSSGRAAQHRHAARRHLAWSRAPLQQLAARSGFYGKLASATSAAIEAILADAA